VWTPAPALPTGAAPVPSTPFIPAWCTARTDAHTSADLDRIPTRRTPHPAPCALRLPPCVFRFTSHELRHTPCPHHPPVVQSPQAGLGEISAQVHPPPAQGQHPASYTGSLPAADTTSATRGCCTMRRGTSWIDGRTGRALHQGSVRTTTDSLRSAVAGRVDGPSWTQFKDRR
jgi:hypothetical protein